MSKKEIKGYQFLYAREFQANVVTISEMIRDGEIEVTVDYNRVGGAITAIWEQHLLIYRIKVLK